MNQINLWEKEKQWHRVFVSIGSNVGDSVSHLHRAIALMETHGDMEVLAVSPFYRTRPQNYEAQEWFVNAAVKLRTCLGDPFLLLRQLQSMERKMDKEGKPFRFGPRIIDLDIVLFDDLCLKTRELEIPHPRMHERRFVLKPVCDIGAQVVHPVLQKTIRELLNAIEHVSGQEVIALGA